MNEYEMKCRDELFQEWADRAALARLPLKKHLIMVLKTAAAFIKPRQDQYQ